MVGDRDVGATHVGGGERHLLDRRLTVAVGGVHPAGHPPGGTQSGSSSSSFKAAAYVEKPVRFSGGGPSISGNPQPPLDPGTEAVAEGLEAGSRLARSNDLGGFDIPQ